MHTRPGRCGPPPRPLPPRVITWDDCASDTLVNRIGDMPDPNLQRFAFSRGGSPGVAWEAGPGWLVVEFDPFVRAPAELLWDGHVDSDGLWLGNTHVSLYDADRAPLPMSGTLFVRQYDARIRDLSESGVSEMRATIDLSGLSFEDTRGGHTDLSGSLTVACREGGVLDCGGGCPPDRFCDDGQCSCSTSGPNSRGSIECGGVCVDRYQGPDDCGACGVSCAAGTQCLAGMCHANGSGASCADPFVITAGQNVLFVSRDQTGGPDEWDACTIPPHDDLPVHSRIEPGRSEASVRGIAIDELPKVAVVLGGCLRGGARVAANYDVARTVDGGEHRARPHLERRSR